MPITTDIRDEYEPGDMVEVYRTGKVVRVGTNHIWYEYENRHGVIQHAAYLGEGSMVKVRKIDE